MMLSIRTLRQAGAEVIGTGAITGAWRWLSAQRDGRWHQD
jgi:hypothetical protein